MASIGLTVGRGVPNLTEAENENARGPAGGSDLALWSRPGYLVRRLHQIHSAIFAEECRHFGITPVQYGLMTALKQFPGSDQVTLGREVGIDRTNVADVLERLAERGLVFRARSGRDRRSMIAELTTRGQKAVDDMFESMQRAQERLLAPLQAEFRPAFLAMMAKLVEGNQHYGSRDPEGDNFHRGTPPRTDG